MKLRRWMQLNLFSINATTFKRVYRHHKYNQGKCLLLNMCILRAFLVGQIWPHTTHGYPPEDICLDSICSLTELEDLEVYSQLVQDHTPSIVLNIWLLIKSSISETHLSNVCFLTCAFSLHVLLGILSSSIGIHTQMWKCA